MTVNRVILPIVFAALTAFSDRNAQAQTASSEHHVVLPASVFLDTLPPKPAQGVEPNWEDIHFEMNIICGEGHWFVYYQDGEYRVKCVFAQSADGYADTLAKRRIAFQRLPGIVYRQAVIESLLLFQQRGYDDTMLYLHWKENEKGVVLVLDIHSF